MVKEEIVQKLFYVDNKYHQKMLHDKTPREVKDFLDELKKTTIDKSLEDIRKELSGNTHFTGLGQRPYCKLIEIETWKFCVDFNHRTEFSNAWQGTTLMSVANNLDNDNKTAERVNSIKEIAKILIMERPSIVRKCGNNYEVLMGNHAIISLIRKGEKKCGVLCICEEHEAQDFPNLRFN